MKKIKMIALDMDGTLLNDEKQISPYTKQILENAIEDGVIVLACTGRPANAIPEPFMELKGAQYAISSNGAVIMDIANDEVISRDLIHKEDINKLLDIVCKYRCYREVFWDGYGHAEKRQFEQISHYLSGYMIPYIKQTRRFVEDLQNFVEEKQEDCDKLHIAFADMEERAAAIREIKNLGDYELEAAMVQSIEITAPGISKGSAIIKLGQMLGVSKDEIMAIGDGMNDASMLRTVGLPVAMGNAVPEIKALATYITASNNEDGVAKAIEKFCGK